MQCQAVKRRPRPGYPTRREVRLDPRLLAENLPWAWRGNARLVQAAAALIALQAAGCGVEREPGGEPERPAVVGEARDARPVAPVVLARVAPLFLHGDGRGADGCVVMNPPLFLSEEEALQIIVEELSRHGLDLAERQVVVDKVTITPRQLLVVRKRDGSEERRLLPDEAKATALTVDLADRKKRVSVEFVGRNDFDAMGGVDGSSFELLDERTGKRTGMWCSGSDYDFPDVIQRVRTEIERQGRAPWYYGLFYDPMVSWRLQEAIQSVSRNLSDEDLSEEDWKKAANQAADKARNLAQKEARDLLRAQVRDFAAWLKAEGVI